MVEREGRRKRWKSGEKTGEKRMEERSGRKIKGGGIIGTGKARDRGISKEGDRDMALEKGEVTRGRERRSAWKKNKRRK